MGFDKKQKKQGVVADRTCFRLEYADDRRRVREFEAELEEYENRSAVIPNTFATTKNPLSGFELYLHEKGLLVYTRKYPGGAIRDVEGYRMAKMKFSALQKLRGRREYANAQEVEAAKARVKEAVTK